MLPFAEGMTERRRMLAIAYGPATMAEALTGLPEIRSETDCVELRLDLFEESFDLAKLLDACGDLPVVATLRPPDQGGRSTLPAADRLRVLVQAAELGAQYVDLEYDAATPDAIARVRAAGARMIVSRHDFAAMPPLEAWWHELAAQDADVVKVVGTASTVADCLPVLQVLQRATMPTIAIAMGAAGVLSRVLALRGDQCLLTYATLGSGAATAPGQLTAREMRELYHAERIGSATAVFGLLGPHLETERLAEYNAWFARDAVDAVAVPFVSGTDAPGIVSAYAALPVAGWHVHGGELQSTVGQALDDLAPSACRQGKVNSIVARRAEHALVGHWVESPAEQYEVWRSEL
jgi:3-dehydroquinate dehydratase/shikimate dehydrogenase